MLHSAFAFEGRVTAAFTRGGQTTTLLYTAGTNFLRVEVTTPDQPNPVNLLDLTSGEMTLLFPGNRSFVRFKPAAEGSSAMPPGFPQMPAMPNLPAPQGVGPTNLPDMPTPPSMPVMPNLPPGAGFQSPPGMPAMPMMPPPMTEQMHLTGTGDQTNLLGYACKKFEIKERGETMEIWATEQLFQFQPYQQNQPHRFGPRMIEERWGGLLAGKKLFPLLATLKFDNGAERLRFEVKSVTPQKLTDEDAKLFQPPDGYMEIQPLPF